MKIHYLEYSKFDTREKFRDLLKNNPDTLIYRQNDKIFYWRKDNSDENSLKGKSIIIDAETDPKIFSKIIEQSIINHFRDNTSAKVIKNKYSNTWEIISKKDLLQNQINGLILNNQVNFNTYFFKPNNRILFGFMLSTNLKSKFIWEKTDFEKNGIDTTGLKGKENIIFANKQSVN
jgi:hypothetical protein